MPLYSPLNLYLIILWILDFKYILLLLLSRAYLRGGFRGFKPPPKFSDFFLKSEGKEIERKRKKRDVGGGGVTS